MHWFWGMSGDYFGKYFQCYISDEQRVQAVSVELSTHHKWRMREYIARSFCVRHISTRWNRPNEMKERKGITRGCERRDYGDAPPPLPLHRRYLEDSVLVTSGASIDMLDMFYKVLSHCPWVCPRHEWTYCLFLLLVEQNISNVKVKSVTWCYLKLN